MAHTEQKVAANALTMAERGRNADEKGENAHLSNANEVTVHGFTVSRADGARYAPVFAHHPGERYFPVSIEQLLSHATLVHPDGSKVEHPTVDAMALEQAPEARILLSAEVYHGAALDAQNRICAPVYLTPQIDPSLAFVDFTYFLLYAYNGPQSLHFAPNSPLSEKWFDCTIEAYAEHEGDIESATVRVSIKDGRLADIVHVRCEAHGDSYLTHAPHIEMVSVGGVQHPVVRMSLNSHATFMNCDGEYKTTALGRVFNPDDRQQLTGLDLDIFDVIDSTPIPPEGHSPLPLLQPFADDGTSPTDRLVLIGLQDKQPIAGNSWVLFRGRIGREQVNTYIQAVDIIGGQPAPKHLLDLVGTVFTSLINKAVGSFVHGNGPTGIVGRPVANVDQPMALRESSAIDLLWSRNRVVPSTLLTGTPAAVVMGDRLYLFFQEMMGGSSLWFCSFAPETGWENAVRLPYHGGPPSAVLETDESIRLVFEDRVGKCTISSAVCQFREHAPYLTFGEATRLWSAGFGTVGRQSFVRHGSRQILACNASDRSDIGVPADGMGATYMIREDGLWSPQNLMMTVDGCVIKSDSTPVLAACGDKLFCFIELRGSLLMTSFDPVSHTWANPAPVPGNYGSNGTCAVEYNGRLLLLRVCAPAADREARWAVGIAFDPATETWSEDSLLPTPSPEGHLRCRYSLQGAPAAVSFRDVLHLFSCATGSNEQLMFATARKPH